MNFGSTVRKVLIFFVANILSCYTTLTLANANSLPKCDPSVLKPRIVKTPSDVTPAIAKYVKANLQNSLKSIDTKSMLRPAPAYTLGVHNCYFTDPKIESGYNGFLPKGVPFGYEVLITLKKEQISGGYSLIISFAKVSGTWKVLEAGSGP